MRGANFLFLVAFLAPGTVFAEPMLAGSATRGGAVPGAEIIRVTTLSDAGEGSLRAAIQNGRPKIIVFDVGGTIRLASDIKIATNQTTIAGQTAPDPGITLSGGTLLVRASDIVVQHIAVRPGPGETPKANGNRDAITIGGGKHPLHDIRVENVSLSWSVDENASIAGGTRNVTIRNSIIAEALNNAGHPKGPHSMGLLINKDNEGIEICGNLLVSNKFRNPVIARGSAVFVGYNYIVNPGENSIHFYDAEGAAPIRAAIVGNVVEAGMDSDDNVTAVQIPDDMAARMPDAQIYLAGNSSNAGAVTNRGGFRLADTPPVATEAKPIEDVRAFVLQYAGMRPKMRNEIDARIIAGIEANKARIVDAPPDPQTGQSSKSLVRLPEDPFALSGIKGVLRIEAWLCAKHIAAGGPNTPECPKTFSDYNNAYL